MSFYVLSYSLLTVVLLFALARPVWIWGKAYDLRTQGAQLANDLVGNYVVLKRRQMIVIAKTGMLLLTLLASWLANLSRLAVTHGARLRRSVF